jgi:hypothetical protein
MLHNYRRDRDIVLEQQQRKYIYLLDLKDFAIIFLVKKTRFLERSLRVCVIKYTLANSHKRYDNRKQHSAAHESSVTATCERC